MSKKNFDYFGWGIGLVISLVLLYMFWGLKMPYEIDKEFTQEQTKAVDNARK